MWVGLLSLAQNSVSCTGQADPPDTLNDVAARHGLRRPGLVRDLAVLRFNAVQLERCVPALALMAIDKLQQAWCATQWDSNLGHIRGPKNNRVAELCLLAMQCSCLPLFCTLTFLPDCDDEDARLDSESSSSAECRRQGKGTMDGGSDARRLLSKDTSGVTPNSRRIRGRTSCCISCPCCCTCCPAAAPAL